MFGGYGGPARGGLDLWRQHIQSVVNPHYEGAGGAKVRKSREQWHKNLGP